MECKKCFHIWKPKCYRPKECPNCKSRDYWNDEICFICGKEIIPRKQIHHIDGDDKNNSLHNLLSICSKCHHLIHHPKNKNNWKVNADAEFLLKKYSNLWFKKKGKLFKED